MTDSGQLDMRETLKALCQLYGVGTMAYAYDFHPAYLAMARSGEVKIGPRLQRLLTAKADDGGIAA